jgi:broad specificity phosphatase PhoE
MNNTVIKPQKWPDELIIVRHGQSTRNIAKDKAKAEGKQATWADGLRDIDTELTPTGHMQALAVGVTLRERYPRPTPGWVTEDQPIDVIYCSPYVRTKQTTDAIIQGLGYSPEVIPDERIREIEFGLLDGLTPEGVRAKYPEEVERRKVVGKYWYRPPGGESRPDVRLRNRSFIDTIVRDCVGLRVLVVTHSVVVLTLRSLLEKWGEEEYMQVDREDDVKNCSITTYKFEHEGSRKLKLAEYNTIVYPSAK